MPFPSHSQSLFDRMEIILITYIYLSLALHFYCSLMKPVWSASHLLIGRFPFWFSVTHNTARKQLTGVIKTPHWNHFCLLCVLQLFFFPFFFFPSAQWKCWVKIRLPTSLKNRWIISNPTSALESIGSLRKKIKTKIKKTFLLWNQNNWYSYYSLYLSSPEFQIACLLAARVGGYQECKLKQDARLLEKKVLICFPLLLRP